MDDHPLHTPEIAGRRLSYRSSAWTGTRLLVDGQPVRLKRGVGEVVDAAGTAHRVQMRVRPLDPAPTFVIGARTIETAPPLAWHEYVWCALPLGLLIGGALGGGIGAAAAFANLTVFRSAGAGPARWVRTGLVTAAAVALYVVLVGVLAAALER